MNRTTMQGPILVFACLLVPLSGTKAAELGSRPPSWEPRVAAAKSLSPAGGLLANEQPGQPWRTLGPNSAVHSRDLLLALPGMKARVESAPRAVELTLWGNLPKQSDFTGLESAVVLHDSRAFDLDFTLYRGRVLVGNHKEKGSARVWLRIDGAAFQLTLGEPGDVVCLALNSYWPRGVPFTISPPAQGERSSEDEGLVRTLNIVAVKGQVDVKVSGVQHSLSAPPGLGYFHWDSVNGPAASSRPLRELEAWADPARKEATSSYKEALAKYQTAAKENEPRTALLELLSSARSQKDRQLADAMAEFAVFGLTAINDIDGVMQALDDTLQAAARHTAAIALRHWISGDAGRDRMLYQFLMDRLRYPKYQAATVLQLLHRALAADDPDTYETLIAYLRHEKLAIRELAWRHLAHLVPEDILVPYDPAATPDQRAKAYAAWKELIPSGSLPARKGKKK